MGMSDSGFEAIEPDIGAIPEITTLKQEHGEGGLAGNRLGRLSGECVAQLPTSVPSERLGDRIALCERSKNSPIPRVSRLG